MVTNFPLFLTSCKRSLDAFSDLYFRYVHYVTWNIQRTLGTTWNYTCPNLEIACNKLSFLVDVPGPLLGRDPSASILVNDHLPYGALSICILVGCLWEVQLYLSGKYLLRTLIFTSLQGCQNAPATGAIAGYSEVFAGCKLLEKREK